MRSWDSLSLVIGGFAGAEPESGNTGPLNCSRLIESAPTALLQPGISGYCSGHWLAIQRTRSGSDAVVLIVAVLWMGAIWWTRPASWFPRLWWVWRQSWFHQSRGHITGCGVGSRVACAVALALRGFKKVRGKVGWLLAIAAAVTGIPAPHPVRFHLLRNHARNQISGHQLRRGVLCARWGCAVIYPSGGCATNRRGEGTGDDVPPEQRHRVVAGAWARCSCHAADYAANVVGSDPHEIRDRRDSARWPHLCSSF